MRPCEYHAWMYYHRVSAQSQAPLFHNGILLLHPGTTAEAVLHPLVRVVNFFTVFFICRARVTLTDGEHVNSPSKQEYSRSKLGARRRAGAYWDL